MLSPGVIRLIVNSYTRQKARVLWGQHMSKYFILSNGVKQGGVLSPRLFTMYIDSLLIELKKSGYGCHINGTFMGALSYADDITLLCPSLKGLNKMLSICSSFAVKYDITFNSKKTECIKFGKTLRDCETALLNGIKIKWVNKIRHLGNHLDINLTDEVDCQDIRTEYVLLIHTMLFPRIAIKNLCIYWIC